jgi:hypothetical protein
VFAVAIVIDQNFVLNRPSMPLPIHRGGTPENASEQAAENPSEMVRHYFV